LNARTTMTTTSLSNFHNTSISVIKNNTEEQDDNLFGEHYV
jgi:hypothetical protein